jgi:hypothetical protein
MFFFFFFLRSHFCFRPKIHVQGRDGQSEQLETSEPSTAGSEDLDNSAALEGSPTAQSSGGSSATDDDATPTANNDLPHGPYSPPFPDPSLADHSLPALEKGSPTCDLLHHQLMRSCVILDDGSALEYASDAECGSGQFHRCKSCSEEHAPFIPRAIDRHIFTFPAGRQAQDHFAASPTFKAKKSEKATSSDHSPEPLVALPASHSDAPSDSCLCPDANISCFIDQSSRIDPPSPAPSPMYRDAAAGHPQQQLPSEIIQTLHEAIPNLKPKWPLPTTPTSTPSSSWSANGTSSPALSPVEQMTVAKPDKQLGSEDGERESKMDMDTTKEAHVHITASSSGVTGKVHACPAGRSTPHRLTDSPRPLNPRNSCDSQAHPSSQGHVPFESRGELRNGYAY